MVIRARLAFLFLLPLFSLGCAQHQMRKFDVNVSLDDSLREDSTHRLRPVEVNVIGVSPDALATWENKSITDYFKPPDLLRRSAEKGVLRLGPDAPSATFSAADPLWDTWKSEGAASLLIICDFPRQPGGSPGDQDPRRRTLPLDESRWGDRRTINVVVKSDGLTVLTQPAPP
jgi:hypothetical protein